VNVLQAKHKLILVLCPLEGPEHGLRERPVKLRDVSTAARSIEEALATGSVGGRLEVGRKCRLPIGLISKAGGVFLEKRPPSPSFHLAGKPVPVFWGLGTAERRAKEFEKLATSELKSAFCVHPSKVRVLRVEESVPRNFAPAGL